MQRARFAVRAPFRGSSFGPALEGQVLVAAQPAQQVVGVAAAALAAKPAVHIGAVAAVALAVSAAPTAWMVPLHVLVEAHHTGLTQLTHHHFFSVLRFTDVLHSKICMCYLCRRCVCALDRKHVTLPHSTLSLSGSPLNLSETRANKGKESFFAFR